MIPVGHIYRANGPLEFRAVWVTVILGVVTAILSAACVWLWEISPVRTLVLITLLFQGLIVGGAFGFMIGRLHMRNPRLVGTIAFCCGLLSIGLVHFGHHLRLVSIVAEELRADVHQSATLNANQKREILQKIDADPAAAVNPLLLMKTGSSGFLGTLKLRNEQGIHIKLADVSGRSLWILWTVEALLVAILAQVMASAAANKPYCEECADWCQYHPDVLMLLCPHAQPLVEAVNQNNLALTRAIIHEPANDDAPDYVGIDLHICPHCEQTFADISRRAKRENSVKVTSLVKHIRVSPEMAGLLGHENSSSKGESMRRRTANDDGSQRPASGPDDNATA